MTTNFEHPAPLVPDEGSLVADTWADDEIRAAAESAYAPTALLAGVPQVYSTSEAAEFYGRSNQWLYWGMRNKIFRYPGIRQPDGVIKTHYDDGTEIPFEKRDIIEPERIGKGGRRRFTLPIIRAIAISCYNRGNFKKDELLEILTRVKHAELGHDTITG